MLKVVAIRPNGNYEVYEVSKRVDARAKRKQLLNTHAFAVVKVVRF